MNWNQIFEGWRNKIIPPARLKLKIEETAMLRTDICRKCPYDSLNDEKSNPLRWDEHCTQCGCTISAKTRCLSCRCPLAAPKWDAVITKEQEEEIKEINNGKEVQNSEGSSGDVVEHSG